MSFVCSRIDLHAQPRAKETLARQMPRSVSDFRDADISNDYRRTVFTIQGGLLFFVLLGNTDELGGNSNRGGLCKQWDFKRPHIGHSPSSLL